ncbi:hypothetical protein C8R43DRAFT_972355 [Mycena crocata]|nr:hypothetical protein C8R43DRAFT_972355 [Mycena crocata]
MLAFGCRLTSHSGTRMNRTLSLCSTVFSVTFQVLLSSNCNIHTVNEPRISTRRGTWTATHFNPASISACCSHSVSQRILCRLSLENIILFYFFLTSQGAGAALNDATRTFCTTDFLDGICSVDETAYNFMGSSSSRNNFSEATLKILGLRLLKASLRSLPGLRM